MNRRTDYHMALLIEAVLNARERVGISTSARTLQGLGVPLEVAVRLLARPWDRRDYRVKQPQASQV